MKAYLNRMIDSSFRRNYSGRVLFYPWGRFGRGYVIVDDQQEKTIRRFLRCYYLSFCVMSILSIATIGTFGLLLYTPIAILIWPIKVIKWVRKMGTTQLAYADARPV